MDEKPSTENPPQKDFNKLDLSQLQGFSFGTQWAQEKHEPRPRADGREDAPRRSHDRRDREAHGAPGTGALNRDRRGFRRPGGGAPQPGESRDANAGAPGGRREHERLEDVRGRGQGEARGMPRRENGHGGGRGDRRGGHGERGPRFGGREGAHGGVRHEDRGPYISPYFTVTFYPEDASFAALSKTIRSSCRTFELFDIAKTVIGKPERFVVVLARKPADAAHAEAPPAAPATVGGSKPAPIYLSVPDGIPFENEESAIAHVIEKHLGLFFDIAEVEVEPPKGNYLIVNRCGVTGELLGPPNYHRYNQILQQHFSSRIRGMSLEVYRSRVESVRDAEVVNQWLEKMKKATRYTWKQADAPAAEGQPPPVVAFDSFEEARLHLLTQARDKIVKSVDNARFHGTLAATMPPGEIRRSVEGALERQRRFPLDTANALRGRLRREGFTIFKKGSKGISYVCAVKRKFRVPGQTFSETIGSLIAFIESNPMVRAGDLPGKLLGLSGAPAAAAAGAQPAEGLEPPQTMLSAEDQNRLTRMQGDLRWLVTEGYVTEFLDGRLFAAPAMVEARKKEIESAEHDPENFPEAPAPEPSRDSTPEPRSEPIAESAPTPQPPPEAAPVPSIESVSQCVTAEAVPAAIETAVEPSPGAGPEAAPRPVEPAP